MEYRVGLGYDVHRFIKGRKLFLGGVEVPYPWGLDGHSDADAVLHAVCDAILGALGRGDIGEHFPNTDARYRGISSLKLLEDVDLIARSMGFQVQNIDIVVIAEEPNIKNVKPTMKSRIAATLKIDESRVNIKATTHEGLGSIGRREGLAAQATAMLVKEK